MTDGFEAPNLRQIPPTDEDEFFAREDRERISELQAQRRKREQERSLEAHWMRCPKCGEALEEIARQGLLIDRCPGCQGVWMDVGEFAALVGKCESGLADRLFGWLKP